MAKNGSGDCLTINEAVDRVPKKSNSRFVIYVTAGAYVQNVNIDKSKWNVMIYGDGNDKTIVSGSLSNRTRVPTFRSATFGTLEVLSIDFHQTSSLRDHLTNFYQ